MFAEYIHGLDKDKIQKWYNGYNFLAESVYNPFDVLLYLTIKEKEHFFDQEYQYRLGFPNHEVKKTLTGSFLNLLAADMRK